MKVRYIWRLSHLLEGDALLNGGADSQSLGSTVGGVPRIWYLSAPSGTASPENTPKFLLGEKHVSDNNIATIRDRTLKHKMFPYSQRKPYVLKNEILSVPFERIFRAIGSELRRYLVTLDVLKSRLTLSPWNAPKRHGKNPPTWQPHIGFVH